MNAAVLEQARHELAAELLRSQGSFRLRVTGSSMLPTLWAGDILSIQSCDARQARCGELVLCAREERFFVHRLLRKLAYGQETFLITRGDCMPKEDPPVPVSALLGKVTKIERDGLVFSPRPSLPLASRTLAAILQRSNLVCSILLRLRGAMRRASSEKNVGGLETAV